MDTNIVTLQFSEPTNQVKAVIQFPTEGFNGDFVIDDVWIQKALKENNFEQFYILPDGIDTLKKALQAKQETMIAIAERRDAQINIELEESNMRAYLKIKAPYGGKQATVEDVNKFMEHMNIKERIDHEAIQEAVKQAKCSHILIASGRPPIDGLDAYFEILVEEDKHFGPTINDKGIANFVETNELSIVQQGDPLMKKVPRTLGENGTDVLGNIIYPVPGKNIQFAEKLDGACVSEKDENLLIAAIKGHPIIEESRVKVDPTYILERVDMSTGNVNFDGSVLVNGDVESNMKIIATGDITINGCMIKAELEAGGRVVINQGIIGGDLARNRESSVKRGTIVKCGGTLTTGFIDNAYVEVQGNIFVKDYVMNSDIVSNGDIIVGSSGYKGHIVGGNIQALHLISANVLGSNAQVITKVKVGIAQELTRKYENKVQKLKECEATLNSLSKAFIEMGKREAQGPLGSKAKLILTTLVNTLKAIVPTVSVLEGETHSLKSKIGDSDTVKIIVRERVFSGVELNLCDKNYMIERNMVGGVFELKGEVTISPLGSSYK